MSRMHKNVVAQFAAGFARGAGISAGIAAAIGIAYVANGAGITLPNVTGGQALTSTAWNDLVNKVNDLETRSSPKSAYSATYTTANGTDTVTLTRTGMIYAETWSHDSSTGDAITTISINGEECSKDRMYFAAGTNSYSQGTCTRILPAGTHTVATYANGAQGRKRTVWAIEF